MMQIIQYVTGHWMEITELIAAIIGVASLIVKITPTLKDDNFLLPIVQFIGKYIALDKYGPTTRPK
jgi:hypothetical protein